ncbi:protein phosphatase 2C domain-containing protein [Streptomyces sp. NPDC005963]|uniref:protein phosphatase 2C domain-containing protein n=1 Tax=Streptomyces sp. NPDC005963 TaxID=3156721 RepID=UPI0033EB4A5C
MSQQAEDDWWNRLYDESTPDTGPTTRTGDTLDTRFDSASDAVTPSVPDPRTAPVPGTAPQRREPHPTKRTNTTNASITTNASNAPNRANARDGQGTEPGQVVARAADEATERERHEPVDRPSRPVVPPDVARPAPSPPTEPPATPTEPPADPPRTQRRPAAPTTPHAPRPRAPWEPPVPEEPAAQPVPPPAPTAAPRPPARPAADVPQRPSVPPAFARTPGPRTTGPDRPRSGYVGDRPPTYDPEPTALPAATPEGLGHTPSDTVLDGARYGSFILRAASVRGDSARYRGEPRRDALLTVRFGNGTGALVLVAVASGVRSAGAEVAHRAAADACHWIGGAVGRSHARLSEDIRAGRRGDLKSGLHRLTDRSLGKLRASAVDAGAEPGEYRAGLRCLLLSADPACRTRVYFGVGAGGLLRLRDGVWQDIEPEPPQGTTGEPVLGYGSARPQQPGPEEGSDRSLDAPPETPAGDRLTMDLGIPSPPSPYVEIPSPGPTEPFRFRASVAQPGDTLLLCSPGLAEPLRSEPELSGELANRWTAAAEPPGLAAFLADVQLRATGYADDRTAVAVWET